MILSNLKNKLVELGLPTDMVSNLEVAHNRFIRSTVENNPSLKRVANFMTEVREDQCDEFGDEKGNAMVDLSIAHGAIMHFSRAKLKINNEGKIKERIGKDEMIKDIVAEYQSSLFRPEYDILSVDDEYFEL